jgi:hypothetical protein
MKIKVEFTTQTDGCKAVNILNRLTHDLDGRTLRAGQKWLLVDDKAKAVGMAHVTKSARTTAQHAAELMEPVIAGTRERGSVKRLIATFERMTGEEFNYGTWMRWLDADPRKRMWPTPDTCAGGTGPSQMKRNQPRLQDAVKFATPCARDWKEQTLSMSLAKAHGNTEKSRHLPRQLSAECPELHGGQLNPTWVEWLMGWPLGWTDLKPSETDRFPQWQHSHGTS